MNANSRTVALVVCVLVVSVAAGIGVGYGFASTSSSGGSAKPVSLFMVVEGHSGGSLAVDNKTHDTMMPENLTVYMNQPVTLTVTNYDEGQHTVTNAALGIDFVIPGRTAAGVPSVAHFTFTPTKTGSFYWYCRLPCDAGQGGWAMTPGKGQATQPGYMGGWITVLSS